MRLATKLSWSWRGGWSRSCSCPAQLRALPSRWWCSWSCPPAGGPPPSGWPRSSCPCQRSGAVPRHGFSLTGGEIGQHWKLVVSLWVCSSITLAFLYFQTNHKKTCLHCNDLRRRPQNWSSAQTTPKMTMVQKNEDIPINEDHPNNEDVNCKHYWGPKK